MTRDELVSLLDGVIAGGPAPAGLNIELPVVAHRHSALLHSLHFQPRFQYQRLRMNAVLPMISEMVPPCF